MVEKQGVVCHWNEGMGLDLLFSSFIGINSRYFFYQNVFQAQDVRCEIFFSFIIYNRMYFLYYSIESTGEGPQRSRLSVSNGDLLDNAFEKNGNLWA